MKKSIFEKNWLVHRILDKYLSDAAERFAKGRLLDIGCGEKPYKHMFAPYVSDHIGLDHQDSLHSTNNVDIIGTAHNIPKESEYFDCILCTAVLEHLEYPDKAISEANRVLKKGGIAIYTIPLFWHLHEEPRDFYRFTKHGTRHLFEKNGFQIIELKAMCGFWVTFGQELVYYLWRFRRGIGLSQIISLLGAIIQSVAYVLDKIDKAEEFTWMYLVVSKKVDQNITSTK